MLCDRLEDLARALVEGVAARGWTGAAEVCESMLDRPVPGAVASLTFACEEVVPRLLRTTDETRRTVSEILIENGQGRDPDEVLDSLKIDCQLVRIMNPARSFRTTGS